LFVEIILESRNLKGVFEMWEIEELPAQGNVPARYSAVRKEEGVVMERVGSYRSLGFQPAFPTHAEAEQHVVVQRWVARQARLGV
jgi:hypothetical protein